MTATQIKYARERAKAIYTIRARKLRERFDSLTVSMSRNEKVAALASGAFSIDPTRARSSWADAVVFSGERPFDRTGFDDAARALAEEFQTLEDTLMLGAESEALELLAKFEAGSAA